MIALIVVVIIILLLWSIFKADRRTAVATSQAAQMNQMMLDAMTPEQQARVVAADARRKQDAADAADDEYRRRSRLLVFLLLIIGVPIFIAHLFGPKTNKQAAAATIDAATATNAVDCGPAFHWNSALQKCYPNGDQWTPEMCAKLAPDAVYRDEEQTAPVGQHRSGGGHDNLQLGVRQSEHGATRKG